MPNDKEEARLRLLEIVKKQLELRTQLLDIQNEEIDANLHKIRKLIQEFKMLNNEETIDSRSN